MKVSVITPTYQREEYLPRLLHYFFSQSHEDKELLVLDDSPVPSPLLSGHPDPRIRYFHSRERISIGEKRNRLIEASSGEIVAHFDDDDYYAPGYLERMLQHLDGHDLVKLSRWFVFSPSSDCVFYWETDRQLQYHYCVQQGIPTRVVCTDHVNADFAKDFLWGYGFSYVFRRALWPAARFEPLPFGSDKLFVGLLQQQGRSLHCFPDEEGLALHYLHPQSTSRVFPQHMLPAFVSRRLFGGRITTLPLVPACLQPPHGTVDDQAPHGRAGELGDELAGDDERHESAEGQAREEAGVHQVPDHIA